MSNLKVYKEHLSGKILTKYRIIIEHCGPQLYLLLTRLRFFLVIADNGRLVKVEQ